MTSSPGKRRGFPAQREPGPVPVGFRTDSPGVGGAGFDPRPGASCGPVTGAPIRKRVIAARFLNATLSQAVVWFERAELSRHHKRPEAFRTTSRHIHRRGSHLLGGNPSPGLPAHRRHGGVRPDSRGRQPPKVSGTRMRTVGTADTKRWGSRPPTSGGLWHGAHAIHARPEGRDSLAV